MQLSPDFKEQYEQFKEDNADDIVASTMTYNRFHKSYLPDYAAEKAFVQSDEDRIAWIANTLTIENNRKAGNILCLVDGIRFGKKLQKLIPDSVFLQGSDSMEDRQKIFERYETEDNVFTIATVQIASTGLDIPRINTVVIIDLGKAFTRIIQSIGRGLRKAHDKDSVRILDICTDLKFGAKHLKQRIKYYIEARYEYTKKLIKF